MSTKTEARAGGEFTFDLLTQQEQDRAEMETGFISEEDLRDCLRCTVGETLWLARQVEELTRERKQDEQRWYAERFRAQRAEAQLATAREALERITKFASVADLWEIAKAALASTAPSADKEGGDESHL